MAKFNTYGFKAENEHGNTIIESKVEALSRESAWMKAVAAAFDACEENTGDFPEALHVYRISSPREFHG